MTSYVFFKKTIENPSNMTKHFMSDWNQKNCVSLDHLQPKDAFNPFLDSGDFVWCHVLITFENSLDPDQDQQNAGPDLNLKCFDTLKVFMN